MLKSITEVAPELLSFIEDLHPPLFESRRHLPRSVLVDYNSRVPLRVPLVGLIFKLAEERGLDKQVFLSWTTARSHEQALREPATGGTGWLT